MVDGYATPEASKYPLDYISNKALRRQAFKQSSEVSGHAYRGAPAPSGFTSRSRLGAGGGYPGFQPDFIFKFNDPPAGGLQLVQSIAVNIYNYWINTENAPLQGPIVVRTPTFRRFKFTVQPLGAALTPQKTGLTYCWMLFSIVNPGGRWPGHVTGNIIEGNNQQRITIGKINVDNDPGAVAPAPASVVRREMRWARCFTKVLQAPIIHYPTERVTDDPRFNPGPEASRKISFSCDSEGLADRLDLFIYRAAITQQLKWVEFVRNLLAWNIRVATLQDYSRRQFMVRGRLVAEISVYMQPGVGDAEPDGSSTAKVPTAEA
ncbi:MAG: hypothetical protein Q9173_005812 [Seirophora scorigena]